MQNCGCVMRKIRLLPETREKRKKKKRKKKEITVKGVTAGSTCMPRLYNRRSAGVFSRAGRGGHEEFRWFENRAREGRGRVLCNSGRVIVISLVARLVDRIFFLSLGDWPVLGRTKRGGRGRARFTCFTR